jgi:hypothetical protein
MITKAAIVNSPTVPSMKDRYQGRYDGEYCDKLYIGVIKKKIPGLEAGRNPTSTMACENFFVY